MDIIKQLNEFYYKYDRFQGEELLNEKDITHYHETALEKGTIAIALSESGKLLGYVEMWRISFEQFGRILCCAPFSIYSEDLEHGNICLVRNVTIHPEWRRSWVLPFLRNELFIRNIDAEYFVGEAKRKKTGLVKTFTKQEAYAKWAKELDYGRK